MSLAAALLGVKATVFMTRNSYLNKTQRVLFMRTYGADVYPSPSELTKYGREAIKARPDHPGSLGLAITEAIDFTLMGEGRKYIPGSVLGFVVLHQTVIGQEVLQQMPEEPDLVIGCVGGGSNFSGFSFPMIGARLRNEGFEKTRFLAVESKAAPKLTSGRYTYDFPDTGGLLPMVKMLTLGHDYVPPPTHAAGLRYHGAAPSLSMLVKEGVVEARLMARKRLWRQPGYLQGQSIIPAPESAHAIKAAIDEARRMPKGSVIFFNLSGHGLLDVDAYGNTR